MSKHSWLVCWIGNADLNCAKGEAAGVGPIATAMADKSRFDRVLLLSDFPTQVGQHYREWLQEVTDCPSVEVRDVDLASPINYTEIYEQVVEELQRQGLPREDTILTYHLSPGTPAMAAIWIILAKTRFPAHLVQTSRQHGLAQVDFSFDLSRDFLIDYLQHTNEGIDRLTRDSGASAQFGEVLCKSEVMKRQVERARRIAAFDVPVLVLGETGTGKELFAKAIHGASVRKGKPFVAVNCGAIGFEMANSELFGHKRGAFTGAIEDRPGHFREAEGGTLFLDEIGDLPLEAQVRLLRVLQEKEITPVGVSKPIKVDVRIIAATHRDLAKDVQAGRFREDLFHRLAVGILNLPPLRERGEDLEYLIEHFLRQADEQCPLGLEAQRQLADDAWQLLLQYPWPGNIRELSHTLVRACLWASGRRLSKDDIREALLEMPQAGQPILERSLHNGIELETLLDEVSIHYIKRAMTMANGQKGEAARMLGFSSHQTLRNWMRRLELEAITGADPRKK